MVSCPPMIIVQLNHARPGLHYTRAIGKFCLSDVLLHRLTVAKFGREKELETVRNVIRHASTSYSRHVGTTAGSFVVSSTASHGTGTGDHSDSGSSKSETMMSPSGSATVGSMNAPSPIYLTNGMHQTHSNGSQHSWAAMGGSGIHSSSPGVDTSQIFAPSPSARVGLTCDPPVSSSDGLRRAALGPTSRRARTHAVVVTGPPG